MSRLDEQTEDAMLADALALVREALGAEMAPMAEEIARDPDGWGLFEDLEGGTKGLAELIVGCMCSRIYDAGDESPSGSPAQRFFYALANSWVKGVRL